METHSGKESSSKISHRMLNVLTALVGLATLALGVAWLIYTWIVHLEVPYFAIPLVLTVPVIVAVAFRNCWE
ncbi:MULTISPECIES: hypothetical protein [unclassified Caballeronia]|uniref:hypothetical protein n=1 Tax=unclassified Caballeronia TaxID=2646786 RepID=UPI00285AE439|nr:MULTISPECIES: hypothetical protein [unclassified Caballeronia]MDR5817960.1 hypothetical protein [Caballeronia sp. LZ033]MDR5824920.1 hypothetical protein [Caballeronia sp. LZ043]MDR5882800.1 hypothetical protein [Caballeronia sp. LZ032]